MGHQPRGLIRGALATVDAFLHPCLELVATAGIFGFLTWLGLTQSPPCTIFRARNAFTLWRPDPLRFWFTDRSTRLRSSTESWVSSGSWRVGWPRSTVPPPWTRAWRVVMGVGSVDDERRGSQGFSRHDRAGREVAIPPGAQRAPGLPSMAPGPKILRRAGRAILMLVLSTRFRHRHRHLVIESVGGFPLVVLPEVFNPRLFFSSELVAHALNGSTIPPGARVLDMGTGSGVAALAASRWADSVIAVDINPEAVKCARMNVVLNGMEERITVLQSDLFSALPGDTFDVVLFNPPFFAGTPRASWEYAWRSDNVVERFAAQLAEHLTPRGQALVVFSTEGCAQAGVGAFLARGFNVDLVARRRVLHEVLFLCRCSR